MQSRPESAVSSPSQPERVSRMSGELGSARDAQELLARVATGDERAFEQLYDVIAITLFGLVHRIVRDAAQAEEVTEEVLVEVWRTSPRYQPEHDCALAWVLTTAHHRAVDRIRSELSVEMRQPPSASRPGATA